MDQQTTMSGGPNPAVADGASAGVQSGSGASEGVTGSAGGLKSDNAQASQPGRGSATGNLTEGAASSQNGGLAKVFAGQPETGEKGVTGSAGGLKSDDAQAGQPGQSAQSKGNPGPTQPNETINLPTWAEQLQKKMKSDPDAVAKLAAFKNLDEFVQAYLDVSTQAGGGALPIPGEDSSPEDVQAFYERMGKPKEAAAYSFAKNEPGLAKAAFDANLSESQASVLYKAGLAQLDDARKGIKAALARDFAETDAVIQKEYGDGYDEAIVLMQRGMGNNPKTGELSPIGRALVDAGLAGKPEIVRAFIELGRAVSESPSVDGRFGGGRPESVMQGRGFDYKDTYN